MKDFWLIQDSSLWKKIQTTNLIERRFLKAQKKNQAYGRLLR